MNAQRLRNLTTGCLHTDIDFVKDDLCHILGIGITTVMIPDALEVIRPFLIRHVQDARYWDETHDPDHTGEFDLPEPTPGERAKMRAALGSKPDPLEGKEVVRVKL